MNSEKKLAWYHHFTHIACAKKLRGLRQKLDALRVQNGQSLSKYQGFGRKLICYKGISFFLNLFELQTFCVFKMNHSKPHHQFSTISDFICLHFFFACVLCLLRRNHGYSSSLNRVLGSALTLKGGIS